MGKLLKVSMLLLVLPINFATGKNIFSAAAIGQTKPKVAEKANNIIQEKKEPEFRSSPAEVIIKKFSRPLKFTGNLILYALILLHIVVAILTFFGFKQYRKSSPFLLPDNDKIHQFISKTKALSPFSPRERARHLSDLLNQIIFYHEHNNIARLEGTFLVKLYRCLNNNLRYTILHDILPDFPKMVEFDFEKMFKDQNPFTRWIVFISLVSPSLGFLGTVLGIISVASDLQHSGNFQGIDTLTGIGIALVTTMLGLSLMILSSFIENIFDGQTIKLQQNMLELLSRVNDYLYLGQANKVIE